MALLLVVALACVSAALVFYGRAESGKAAGKQVAAEAPAAPVGPVLRETLSSMVTVAGQFTPYQEVDLHAKVAGYIRRIYVDIGDRVRNGQTIATLEVPELTAQVAGAQAQVRYSQSEIAREKSEVERAESNYVAVHAAYTRLKQAAEQRPGLVAQQELDDSQARDQDAAGRVQTARSAFDATQQQLGVAQADSQRVRALSDYSVVTSPFNGVITRRYADTGSLIQAGTASNTQAMPVVRVAQSDLLRLRMPVPEDDVQYIGIGSAVQVTVQGTHRTFEAKVTRFTRALDTSTRTMLVEVDVPNSNLSLSPGMYAETNIVLQQHKNVLSVPNQAVADSSSDPYVLVVNDADQVEKKPVQLGIQSKDRTEVRGEFTEGERVILSGQTSYQPGEKVRPQADAETKKAGQ